jgi:hypothetical protein
MRYYILQQCWGGRHYLAPMPYTEDGFANRHAARRYLDRQGRQFSPIIVRGDRVASVMETYAKKNN